MTACFDRRQTQSPGTAHQDVPFHIVREPRDAAAQALARALSRRGWNIVVAMSADRDEVNALVADIWDAGGTVRAIGFGPL